MAADRLYIITILMSADGGARLVIAVVTEVSAAASNYFDLHVTSQLERFIIDGCG